MMPELPDLTQAVAMLVAQSVAQALAFLWVFWALYIFMMGIYRAHLTGRLKGLNFVMASPFLAVAFALDFIAQVTVFTVVFVDFPLRLRLSRRHFFPKIVYIDWLVTHRLRRYMQLDDGSEMIWRRRWAEYLCKHLLDPFDPTGAHCDSETPRLA
jgi:hypothetical protein